MAQCEQACRDWGYSDIFLKVEQTNIPAMRLYKSIGYRMVRAYPDGKLLMTKDL